MYVSIFVALLVLHFALYSAIEKFNVLTVVYAVLWSGISLAIYALIAAKFEKTTLSLSLSWLLISLLYFFVYAVLVFPSFLQLKLLGLQIIQGGALTQVGLVYLLVYSIAEGLLLVAAVCAVKYARRLLPL